VINLPGDPHPRYYADLRRADALVADGWAAARLPATLGRAIDHVRKGVDCDRFRPDGPSLRRDLRIEERRVVITVSRLVPIKNVPLVIDAFAIARDHVPDAHLIVVGDGPEGRAARARAAGLGVVDAVTFTGSIPHGDLPAFYRTADVFALSSDFDNSPNAILEAMASGLPVVATDAGGAREFVDVPSGGALVAPHDARALARELERFLVQPEAARTSGAHNRGKASSAFSWRASAMDLLAVYRRVVAARRGAERASA
jgi:phosphatidylinositol alpha-1,6-mannosyltransferase